jgi:hypothetical protein
MPKCSRINSKFIFNSLMAPDWEPFLFFKKEGSDSPSNLILEPGTKNGLISQPNLDPAMLIHVQVPYIMIWRPKLKRQCP